MTRYITPNDAGIVGATDSESIQNAVNRAVESDVRCVLIPRINERTGKAQWDIDRAIILSSNLEIVLDNCLLRQVDGCLDNVFRNFSENITTTKEERQENIRIVGRGNAVIDGGNPENGLMQATSLKDGMPHVSRNNVILFHNLKGFLLENFTIINQRWWGINLLYAEHGRISNLHIHSNCDLPNQDGIDLRPGCHDIILENLTGQAGDDFIALSALGGGVENLQPIPGLAPDIHDITIRNIVATSVNCAVVALRNTDGRKIYNITMDNINDVDNNAEEDGKLWPEYPKHNFVFDIRRNPKGNSPYTLLRIGQDGWYKTRDSILGETYGITATNLRARGGSAIMINIALENSSFSNIYAENGVDYIVTTKSGRKHQMYGADLRNVVFENIFYTNTDNEFATAFDFEENMVERTLENVLVNRAFLGNCKKPFSVNIKGNVKYRDVFGTNVEESDGQYSCVK